MLGALHMKREHVAEANSYLSIAAVFVYRLFLGFGNTVRGPSG